MVYFIMMKKTFTVTTKFTASAEPLRADEDYVIVKMTGNKFLMKKDDWDGLSEINPKILSTVDGMTAFVVSDEWFDRVTENGINDRDFNQLNNYDGSRVVYFDNNYFLYDKTRELINVPIITTVLSKSYDLTELVAGAETELEGVKILKPIYYVPGNGPTVSLSVKLSDDDYAEYVKLIKRGKFYLGKKLMKKAFAKYEREVDLQYDEDEDY